MGFFQSLKDDLSTAMNELINEDSVNNSDSDFDSFEDGQLDIENELQSNDMSFEGEYADADYNENEFADDNNLSEENYSEEIAVEYSEEQFTDEYNNEEYAAANSMDEAISEEPFDMGILDLVSSVESEEEPRSARSAMNSLREANKRLEKKKLQEALENGAVGSIISDDGTIEASSDNADEIMAELSEDSNSSLADGMPGINLFDAGAEPVPNTALDIDVAAMLDKLDLDALAENAGNADAITDENSVNELSGADMTEAADFASYSEINGQMSFDDLLKSIETAGEELENNLNLQADNNEAVNMDFASSENLANESLVNEELINEADNNSSQEVNLDDITALTNEVNDILNTEIPSDIADLNPELASMDLPISEDLANDNVEENVTAPINEEIPVSQDSLASSDIKEIQNIDIPKEVTEQPVAKKAEPAPKLMPVVPSYVPKISNDFSDETAVVTKGMRIVGNVASNGNMDVFGTIVGDISIIGKLSVSGTVVGKSKAHEVFADGAEINGDINVTGTVKVGQNSVIIGNISSTSAVIAGAVKGDIDVQGPVVLDSSAIVMGNIKSMSVQINSGAVIEGLCSQCYAQVNPSSFFDDLKKTALLAKN